MHSSSSHTWLIVTIQGFPALQWGPSIHDKVVGKIGPSWNASEWFKIGHVFCCGRLTILGTQGKERETHFPNSETVNAELIIDGSARDARPPLSVKFLSFSCSFPEKIGWITAFHLHLWIPPPSRNPGSATAHIYHCSGFIDLKTGFCAKF